MGRLKLAGLALLVSSSLSVIVVTTANAEGTEGAPYWSIEGSRLAAGKTQEVIGKAVSNKVLTATTGQVIVCTSGKLKPGAVLIGSNGNEPGRAEGVVELRGCTVTGNGTKCTVEGGGINTEPLTGELAYAENKKSLVGVSAPKKGKVFATIHFTPETGGSCTVASTKVTGEVVGKGLTDESTPVLLELPNHVAPAASWLGEAPTTAIRHLWVVTAGTGKAVETEEINAFGAEAVLTGKDLALLATNGVSNGKLWSPLF
jgi:hypothetical protein